MPAAIPFSRARQPSRVIPVVRCRRRATAPWRVVIIISRSGAEGH